MTKAVRIGERSPRTRSSILELVEAYHIGKLKRYSKGEVLYWEGDPAEYVFVVKRGAVKAFAISREGKAHTYDVLGVGRLAGATVALVGGKHQSTAEALRDTDVYVIPVAEFEHWLVSNSLFSMAVMRELAQIVHSLADKVRDLSFMDVQQRLKHGLVRLAEEHGLVTEGGVKLDLDLTHEEIAALIGANRSTVTSCLTKLKQARLLWKQGRHLILIPLEHIRILDGLSQSVEEGNKQEATSWARKAVDEEVDLIKALDALTGAMKQVDKGFSRGELALSDVLMAVFALKGAMPIVEEAIRRTGEKVRTLGTVVIGTVHGDIHDIGKTIVSTLLTVAGFEVIDLGVDVTTWEFVEAVDKRIPDILAMSALMTTSVSEQGQVIDTLKEEGLRDKARIMVGGGAMTQELAQRIGADGYEPTADGAVGLAKMLIGAQSDEMRKSRSFCCPDNRCKRSGVV